MRYLRRAHTFKYGVKKVSQDTVWIVIAAYNEEETIGNTVANVLTHFGNVVVVDDCSKDNTQQQALQAGAHVLRHGINLGQGAALQTGIEYALASNAQYIVTFDADGQHNATEILPMLSAMQKQHVDIMLGSRFLGKSVNMSRQRHMLLKMAIFFTRITAGLRLTDVHNGFRIMSRNFCQSFEFKQNRMAHASEILSYISRKKVKYAEFPVTITYTDYSMAKGQKATNSLRILMELITGYISK